MSKTRISISSLDVFSNLGLSIGVHIVVGIWSLIFGFIAYGFSLQTLWVALFVTLISYVASAPGMVAIINWQGSFPYLLVGWIVGMLLTGFGSIVYFVTRFFLHEPLPEAWLTAQWVGAISIGFAILAVLMNSPSDKKR